VDGLVLATSTEVRALIVGAVGVVLAGFAIALIGELLARRTAAAVIDATFAPIDATEDALAPMVGRLLALVALVRNIRPQR
jgi:hypothetical protein